MRERVTYILRNSKAGFDPSKLEVTKKSLAVSGLDGAKEHHYTFELEELPQELQRVLRSCHELHLRWATASPYQSIAPYVSRLSPGLHVFYTLLQGRSGKRLCPSLKSIFGAWSKCDSIEEASLTPPILSERFAASAARQYFSYVPTIDDFVQYLQKKVCGELDYPCRLRAQDVFEASYLDIDYDSVSHMLMLRVYWDKSPLGDGSWYETNLKGDKENDALEVGVLLNEMPEEDEELKVGGFLTQVGRNDKPSSTLFSFPARHHSLPATDDLTYRIFFNKPTGLHPNLSISFSSFPVPPKPSCALHAYLTLPSTLFIDKYPFNDSVFLENNNLRALRAISGATDLEAPEWVIKQWGSAALLELAIPESTTSDSARSKEKQQQQQQQQQQNWTATIPLHTRYLPPANASHANIVVPWPNVFFSCPSEASASKFAATPFDRVNLGYDALFGSHTLFFHVPPQKQLLPSSPGSSSSPTWKRHVELIKVPVLDVREAGWWVEWGTVVVVLLGTSWLVWILARVTWYKGNKKGKAVKKE